MSTPLNKTLQFLRRGEIVSLPDVPATRTLLQVLREDLGCTGTKEGCNEGDCGACTVVVAEIEPLAQGSTGAAGSAGGERLKYRAINSCIRLAHSIDGLALWTVEDLAAKDGSLHPAQQSMVENHASQCGFCTPGFVMSLFGMYQNHVSRGQPVSRELAQTELSGNLCRCTGYRPILDAAQRMAQYPRVLTNETDVLLKLKHITSIPLGLEADLAYKLPLTLLQLLQLRTAHPEAQLVAGCTDVGLWINKLHLHFESVIDVTRVSELRCIEQHDGALRIGAAVPLEDAFAALVKLWPQLRSFAERFAGLPVRNSGTLGGNVANGSPIGDTMPLLIALRAQLVLVSLRGERKVPLEDFYTAYRKNVLAADEVLGWILVPVSARSLERLDVGQDEGGPVKSGHFLRVYKISKRYDDDISAVCLALNLCIENGIVQSASIGAGGVAATPVRAVQTEASLTGQPWTEEVVQHAISTLRAEFSPLSDMRASAAYRTEVLGNLLQRYWLESQGAQQINLQSFRLEEAA